MFYYNVVYNMYEIVNQGVNCGGIFGDLDMCLIEVEMSFLIYFIQVGLYLLDGYSFR